MTKEIPTLGNFIEVPEKIVKEAWAALGHEEDSGFKTVLEAAAVYRSAKMTPVIIYNPDKGDIYCVAKETFGKKLH